MPSRKKKGEQSPQPRRAPSHLDVRKRKIVWTARKTVRVIRHGSVWRRRCDFKPYMPARRWRPASPNNRFGRFRRPQARRTTGVRRPRRGGNAAGPQPCRRGAVSQVFTTKNIVRYDNNKYTRPFVVVLVVVVRVLGLCVRARACRLSLSRARACVRARNRVHNVLRYANSCPVSFPRPHTRHRNARSRNIFPCDSVLVFRRCACSYNIHNNIIHIDVISVW